MEIHAPEKPIHTRKEFMFHMFTVVLGILIALALDGMVTWAHHRILVREARANIATELRNNRETIQKAVPEIQARQKQLQEMIATIDAVEKSRKLPAGHLGYNYASYELYSTAWKTASVSGAVTHMEYDQLKDYTDAYDLQQDFLTVQAQGFASVGDLAAALRVLDQDLTKVPQDRLEELQREALKILTVQRTLENISAGLMLAYDKALK
jgi:prefoldin subunit 5